MKSTMQEVPMTVSSILRHVATNHTVRQVITYSVNGSARYATYGDLEERCARLANALRRVGVVGDDRVATMLWNNQEHLEAYAAVPAMGAVLHTLNIRLSPAQLQFIANHAEDKVIIVDGSLVPLLAAVLPGLATVRVVFVTGDGDTPIIWPRPTALPDSRIGRTTKAGITTRCTAASSAGSSPSRSASS